MTPYELEGVEDTTTRIEKGGEAIKSGLSPLDAFDYTAEPLYKFIESHSEKEPESSSVYSGGLHGAGRVEPPSLSTEEEKLLREWGNNRDELTVITEIETVDGNTEDFYWEMRQADPESVNQPFSMVNLKSDSGYNLGLRIARDYDPDLLHRSSAADSSDVNPAYTDVLRNSNGGGEDDWGWIQEPYLCSALDGEEAVHDQLDEEYGFLPELTPDYWVVDWNESPEYDMSDMEMAMIYEWGEPLFTNGLSPEGARRTGEHAASLHSLGLMTFLDRKPEEFVEDPHPEGYRVQQRDLEFAFHTVNENRINGRDMQDLVNQIEQGIRRYHRESGSDGGSETERVQVKERPRQLKERKNELVERIDEDIKHWIPDNVPRKIDPDIFPREVTRGLEWE